MTSRGWIGRSGGAALLVVLLALAGGFGCSPGERVGKGGRVRVPEGTPVVLVSIDTLRSDRLPAYGYDKVATPAIDALRADSILYRQAYSHIPLTLPSHVSLLTGRLPIHSGVRDNVGYRFDADPEVYLPARLKSLGYATGAAVSAYVLRGTTGMAGGFDWYEDSIGIVRGKQLGGLQRPGMETLEHALGWLESVREQPFLLFFHLYEPHTPYEPPEPFASRYASAYDGEVAAADAVVGELVARLRDLGLYDRALIVLFSDHGEGLGDHGYEEHEIFVYREMLQVPLLVKLPASELAGTTVEQPVQLADVAPTVLDALGLELPAGIDGRSLLRLSELPAEPSIYSESYYADLHFGWSGLVSLIKGKHQLILGPDPELFDLEEDPASRVNLLRERRHVAGEMTRELRALSAGGVERPAEVDMAARDKLAALGYLGGTAQRAEGPPIDPKSRLDTLRLLGEAFSLVTRQEHAKAVEILSRLVEAEPNMVDGWEYLGKALHRLGRHEEAVEAYRRALEVSGGAPQTALSQANELLELGRLEEAYEHAELAAPTNEMAHDLLAQIALKQGDLERAERHIADAVASRGTRIGPLITRAEWLLRTQRFEEAVALTHEVEREFGDDPDRELLSGLFQIRGSASARLGRAEEAEAAYLEEIEINPASLPSYAELAFLYALLGRSADAGLTLKKMVETNDTPAGHAKAVEALRAMKDDRNAEVLLRQARRRWPESALLRQL